MLLEVVLELFPDPAEVDISVQGVMTNTDPKFGCTAVSALPVVNRVATLEAHPFRAISNFFHRLSFRRLRGGTLKSVHQAADDHTQLSEPNTPAETSTPPIQEVPDTHHTAKNVLKVALKTLSSVSSNIPFGSILSSVINPLLDITDRIEVTLHRLPSCKHMIEYYYSKSQQIAKPEQSQGLVEALQRELQSITKDLNDAQAQGRLEQFFNSADTSSSLAKHNMTLAQMIADYTFVAIHEVLKALQDLERENLQCPIGSQGKLFSDLLSLAFIPGVGRIEMGDITGGFGGTGGSARMGGEGGEGEGPTLEMHSEEHWKVGDISGGTGGTDGAGDKVGGKGGTDKAPVISVLRRAIPAVVQP
ncbi:hypothetical protein DFH09DRAFT_1309685 [Mycena vulgaris]|nr:hypothetical protein DFH09DRAFT_1309685 [Mycena vulgaris]